MNILECIDLYEAQAGKKLSNEAVQFITRMDNVGKAFEAKGRETAAGGLPAVGDAFFLTWGEKNFPTDPRMGRLVCELMQDCYMDGYTASIKAE